MKLIIFLGLLWSHFAMADLVYMKEDQNGKSIMYQKSELTTAQTINDLSSKSWAIYPDITPDGDELIYAEGPSGEDLHLTYHDLTKNLIQRFHASQKGMILHPKFSKNGKFIFYSAPGPKGKNTIYFFDRQSEVNRQGGKLLDYSLESAKALDESEEAYFPRPSSDGNFLVYQRNSNGKKEIIFYDRIENKKTVLADGMSPSLSFDERWVAYTSKKDGHWNIYVAERTSGVTIQVTSDEKDEMAPTFLPDNTIAFASNKSGHFRLFKIVKGEWISLTETSANEEVDFYSPQFTGDTTLKQTLKAPFIGNPRSSFGSVSHQGRIYMAGGHQGAEHTYPPESFSDQFIVYNPDSNSWLELAPRPVKAHGYQLAAYEGYIYAFGGFSYSETHKPKWKSLDQIDRYDIANNKWETIGNLLTPRSSNAAIKIQDKVYLAGGWNSTPKFDNDYDGVFLDTIEVFDLKSQKIELAHYKLPLPLRRAFTGIEHEGKLLLIGGLGQGASHFDLLNNVTAINPVDGFSQELSPLPFPTFAPAAEILNQTLFVFGGMYKNGEMDYNYVSHIYSLDLALSKWNHTGRCLKETKGFSQVFKLDNKTLGILGGHHYFEGYDLPVSTFETLQLSK